MEALNHHSLALMSRCNRFVFGEFHRVDLDVAVENGGTRADVTAQRRQRSVATLID